MRYEILKQALKGKSQADKILWFLETYGRITNEQCHKLLGIRHAPARIRDLKDKFLKLDLNYEITTERKAGCNRFGEPTWWFDYILVKKCDGKTEVA